MRIAQIVTSVRDGGLERTVLQVCSGLVDAGHQAKVHALLPDNPGAESFLRRGIGFHAYHARNRGILGALFTGTTILSLVRRLRQDRPDVVVVHDFYPAFAGRIAARIARVPRTVAVLHSTYEWIGPRARRLDQILAPSTDAFVAVSHAAREARIAWGGYEPTRIHVVHNGVDPERFHPDPAARARIRAEFAIPDHALLLGSVGVIRESKRQVDLVDAVAALMASTPSLYLMLVGSTRPHEDAYASELEQALLALPSERVRRVGNRDDVPAILAALDLYSAPSESEGFGLALAEALLAGIPAAASSIAAHREIAEGNPAVFFHPPRDPIALRQALGTILDRRLAIPSGRAPIETGFSQALMIKRWIDLLDALRKAT